MSSPKKALIVGYGYVGSYLSTRLQQMSWEVWSLRRTRENSNNHLSIDVTSPFSINSSFDTVFYMVSADAYTPQAYENAYVTGVRHTLQALQTRKKKPRFILVSSTSVFAENSGALVNENSPTANSIFSKDKLLQGESLVQTSGLPHSILRLSGIYGPNRCHLVQQVRSGDARLKTTPMISNRIHVKDCAGILYHLATLEQVEALYIGTDCEPTPYNEVLQWLGTKLKRPLSMEDQASQSTHMSNKRCSNQKICRSGYHFYYPSFREGFMSCL